MLVQLPLRSGGSTADLNPVLIPDPGVCKNGTQLKLSFRLDSLNGGCVGDYGGDCYRDILGDARSIDHGSIAEKRSAAMLQFLPRVGCFLGP